MGNDTIIAKVCEIAAAVIPVLWLAVAVDLRATEFVNSRPAARSRTGRDGWLHAIATVMVASAYAEIVAFYGLLAEGGMSVNLFASMLLVLYVLIGLVLLLIMHAIFGDSWDGYLLLGSAYAMCLVFVVFWPGTLPTAIILGPRRVTSAAEEAEAQPKPLE